MNKVNPFDKLRDYRLTKVNTAAAIILFIMFLLMFGSAWNDSATMDELAHIPAGFGYITQLDYRLNPEHPPLLKVISALSAKIFAKSHFPTDTPYWRDDVNGQWAQGAVFLYESGNDADKIIFWSRIPLIILSLLFGWIIFAWTRRRFGNAVGLLALLLFAFSPTVLAHSRYVTTDLGAAFGFFIGIVGFLRYLEVPSRKNLILAGVIFGIAQLLKFSLVLLIPMYALMVIAWVLTRPLFHWHDRVKVFWQLAINSVAIALVGFLLVWAVYAVFTWNYPQERQFRDAEFILSSYGFRPAVDFNLALIENRFTRPFGQYLLGVLMVNQRAAGGNTAFFLDEVSSVGSRLYFPLLYLLKETLALHILTLIALWFALKRIFWITRTRLSLDGKRLSLGQKEFTVLDGSLHLPERIPHETIIKGDEKIPVISAASIIAKVTRDRTMLRLHKKYPQYGFDIHKGYGTKMHRKMIKKFGRSKIHRKSFRA